MGAAEYQEREVRERIEDIKGQTDDPESAHIDEDNLRSFVLKLIASGEAEDPALIARLALSTNDIEFDRWYA